MAGDLPAPHNVDGSHPVDDSDSDSPYVDQSDNVYDNDAKYNIYAKHLFPLRHGYPLMSPASTNHTGKLVTPHIGDVGCLQEGEFIRFFNATVLPETDTRTDHQGSSGIPDGLEPLPDVQYIPGEPERAVCAWSSRRQCRITAIPRRESQLVLPQVWRRMMLIHPQARNHNELQVRVLRERRRVRAHWGRSRHLERYPAIPKLRLVHAQEHQTMAFACYQRSRLQRHATQDHLRLWGDKGVGLVHGSVLSQRPRDRVLGNAWGWRCGVRAAQDF